MVYDVTLDIIVFILSMNLAYIIYKTYQRTPSFIFKFFAYAMVVFGVVSIIDALIEIFFKIELTEFGFRQIMEILMIIFLSILFSPFWHKPIRQKK